MTCELDLLLTQATDAAIAGRLNEALPLCEQVLANDPAHLSAMAMRGTLLSRLGRHSEAVSQLREVLQARPNLFEALIPFSISCARLGDREEALAAALKSVRLRPDDTLALNNLGLAQMALAKYDEAVQTFKRAVELLPNSSEIAFNLGTALQSLDNLPEARIAFESAVTSAGCSPQALIALGQALVTQDQPEIALRCGQRASEEYPPIANAFVLQAVALARLGRAEEAESQARKAVDLGPDFVPARLALGNALEIAGLNEMAAAEYRTAIELQPNQGSAYFSLAYLRRISTTDEEMVARMVSLADTQGLPKSELMPLHYGLGRIFEGGNEFEKAMRHYDEANRIAHILKLKGAPFNREVSGRNVEMSRRVFTRELLGSMRDVGLVSGLPIFIVGSMRSGTSLMEQILSRHPEVEAAGELPFWTENGPSALDRQGPGIHRDQVRLLAERYLETLAHISPNASHVIDKMPANTIALGLIHLAFPNARIIHMVRNPADTCFSIYVTPNSAKINFAHNKENIVFAYKGYLSLMDHWREVLPKDRFMDVVYEDLVEDTEEITRRVVEFCGLEWSDLCLSPEQNSRTVTTPSNWQVRQPIYKSSIQRWRNFEPWIKEFAELI